MSRIALALALALSACTAIATTGSADSSFYKSVAEGGMGEVALGKLAQDKASDPAIKSFAAMMVKDHSQANDELKALAASKEVSLPSDAGVASATKKTELEALSGRAFDKSYVTNQVKAHEATVALLRKEIASGQDADAKAFAQKVLPTVEAHLKAIDMIADGIGVSHQ